MCTVGYGDITPISNIEKLFAIIMTTVSCGIYAYAVNVVGTIFQTKNQKESDFKYNNFL